MTRRNRAAIAAGGWIVKTPLVAGVILAALVHDSVARVFLTTDDRNEASWRLAERAGFELEGILRNDRRNLAGGLRDTRVYSRIPTSTP